MARKLPRNVRCSILYCSILSCLWALYIWVIFIEIQHTTLQAGKPANDFIFKMQQLHDPFMPSTTSNFSPKIKSPKQPPTQNQHRFKYPFCVLLSIFATWIMWKSSKDLQWTTTEIWLVSFSVLLLLISSCPKEKVKHYERLYFVYCQISFTYHLMRP